MMGERVDPHTDLYTELFLDHLKSQEANHVTRILITWTTQGGFTRIFTPLEDVHATGGLDTVS